MSYAEKTQQNILRQQGVNKGTYILYGKIATYKANERKGAGIHPAS